MEDNTLYLEKGGDDQDRPIGQHGGALSTPNPQGRERDYSDHDLTPPSDETVANFGEAMSQFEGLDNAGDTETSGATMYNLNG